MMKCFVFVGTGLAVMACQAQAAMFYLQEDQGNNSVGNNWNNTSKWWSDPTPASGLGTHPATMAGNDFSTNGFVLRTSPGSTAGSSTFGGDSLTLDGGTIALRTNAGGTSTVAKITSLGGFISTGVLATLSTPHFTNSALTTVNANVGSGAGLILDFGTLNGTGDFAIQSTNSSGAGRYVQFNVVNGSSFTGDLTWVSGNPVTLRFGNGASFGGGLIAQSTSRIFLDQDVSFASVTLGGVELEEGTYTYDYLNTHFDAIFIDGGAGSITVVPEPSAAVLLGAIGLIGCRRRR